MGYEPTVRFEAGLRRTVDWYKENVVPQSGVAGKR